MRLLGGTLPTAGSASAHRLSPRWTTNGRGGTDTAEVTDGCSPSWTTDWDGTDAAEVTVIYWCGSDGDILVCGSDGDMLVWK